MKTLVGGAAIFALISPCQAQMACRIGPDFTSAQHWSWYTIDGRRCWYPGKPRTLGRGALYWAPPAAMPEPEPEPEPMEEHPLEPSTAAKPPLWELDHRWPEGMR